MDAFWPPAAAFEIVILPGCQEVAEPSWHNRGETLFSERNHSPSGHKALLRQLGHLGSASSWGRWGKGRVGGGQASFFTTKTRQESTGVTGVSRPAGGEQHCLLCPRTTPLRLRWKTCWPQTLTWGPGFSGSERRSRFPAEQLHASEHRDTACSALLRSLNHP